MSQKNWEALEALEVQYYSSKDPKSVKDFALALKYYFCTILESNFLSL